jgi:zinc transport system ATP-binding protein
MTALVEAEALSIGFAHPALLPPFNVSIAPGEVILIVGRNGSGKTTLVRTLLGLVAPLAGVVRRRRGLRCTYVPQGTAIDPLVPLQVGELMAWATLRGWSFLRPWPWPRRREGGIAELRVEELLDRQFADLSGGQRQRVLLGRLTDSDAELVVLDEPTAAMDGPATEATYRALRRLADAHQMTSLVVTHEAAAAAPYANRIALLDPDDEGFVIGPPHAIVDKPRFRELFGAALSAPEAAHG